MYHDRAGLKTRLLLFLKLAVWNDGRSRWTHLFGSVNSLFFGEAAPIPADHMHFFPPESGVLDYLIAMPRSVYSSSW
jgi:hypothetical protein